MTEFEKETLSKNKRIKNSVQRLVKFGEELKAKKHFDYYKVINRIGKKQAFEKAVEKYHKAIKDYAHEYNAYRLYKKNWGEYDFSERNLVRAAKKLSASIGENHFRNVVNEAMQTAH